MFAQFLISVTATLLFFGAATSSPKVKELPDMVGVWRAIATGQASDGFSNIEVEFRFTEQKGALFRGVYLWRLPESGDVQMHDGSDLGWAGEEDVMGVIDWDNRSIKLADLGDDGHFDVDLSTAKRWSLYSES